MKVQNLIVGAAFVGAFTFAGAAAVEPPAGKSAGKSAPAASSAMPSHALSLLRRLAGEWEGTVQGRDADGMISSSIINASMRLEESGRVLASRYDGRLFGKEFDAGSVWRVDGQRLSAVWNDSRGGQNVKVDAVSGADANSLSFEGKAVLPGRKVPSNVRQSVRLIDDVSLQVEWTMQNADGKWTPVMSLELHRMKSDEKSSAAERFNEGRIMSSLRQAVGAQTQASVDESR